MGDVADLTIEILKQIRDEIRQTNTQLDQTREELSARLDQTREELSARLDQTNARLDQHERLLVRLADESQVHSRALVRLIDETHRLNDRVDHVLTGPLGEAVQSYNRRLDSLEADVAILKRRAG